ncbi:hypothetical protein [Marinomonas arenicola]
MEVACYICGCDKGKCEKEEKTASKRASSETFYDESK